MTMLCDRRNPRSSPVHPHRVQQSEEEGETELVPIHGNPRLDPFQPRGSFLEKSWPWVLCLLVVPLILLSLSVVLSRPPMEFGVDPSEAYGVLDGGGEFYDYHGNNDSFKMTRKKNDRNTPTHPLKIVRRNGYQWVRLRIMVDPNGEYGLFQDLNYVLRMARDAKQKYGLKFLLDFHYSHWWVDGGNQWSPDRWRTSYHGHVTKPMEEVVPLLYQYTHNVLQVLHEENVLPDAVQVGNEISPGMVWPLGQIPSDWNYQDDDNIPQEWYNLAELLHAGTKAVQDVSKDIQIMIHLDTGGDAVYTSKWMNTFFKLGGECDVIGLSWYPMWHGTVDDLVHNINMLTVNFPKQEIWVVETAYYYEGSCDEKDNDCKKKFPFPMTPQGQSDFLDHFRNTLLKKTKCRAIFYWGSHWTRPSLWFRGGEDWDDARRRALFDKDGHALKGMATLPGSWLQNKVDRWRSLSWRDRI